MRQFVTKPFVIAAILLSVPAFASCSGSDEVKPATGESSAKVATSEAPVAKDKDVESYFNAIVSADLDQLGEASSLVAPGSIADAYLKYHLAGANAAIDGGSPDEPSDLEKVEGGYKTCDDPDDPDDCVTWSDLESVDGKLAKFAVNGKDLTDRISVGDGSTAKAGELGTVEFLVAYQSVQSGDLFVLASVTSGDEPVTLNSGSATYRGPDKRQSQASSYYGPDSLAADSTATLGLIFTSAKPGGEATLTFNSEDFSRSNDAKIKTH
jgi:hypothetical protein